MSKKKGFVRNFGRSFFRVCTDRVIVLLVMDIWPGSLNMCSDSVCETYIQPGHLHSGAQTYGCGLCVFVRARAPISLSFHCPHLRLSL